MTIFKTGIFTALFLSIVTATFAAEIKQIEVTGSGLTKQEAIYAGLIEAVRQVNGVKVASETRTNFKYSEFAVSRQGKQEDGSIAENSINKDIYSKSNGFIEKYEILDTDRTTDNWDIRLLVFIPKYKTPGFSPHNRRKMAVIPFRTKQGSFSFSNKRMPAAEIAGMFAQKLVTEFTQTRKFTVLDREYYEEFLREKDLILSPDAPVAEQMKIGEVLGVDYLVVGTISDASSSINQYKIQLTGETGWERSGLFIVDYRIIVMATRQIKWSDSVKVVLGNDDFQRLGADRPELMEQVILAQAAGDLVSSAMDNIYPLRVAEVQPNGQLILNQGGTGLKEGLLLDVFRKGKRIRDSYTGESLGFAETRIGTAEIVRVTAKTAYARIIDGNAEGISKGDICRRVKPEAAGQEISGRATDVLVPDNGGVVLPFD